MLYRRGLNGLFAVLVGLLSHNPASADQIFVADRSTIGEYTTTGATVNPALISGLSTPRGIAISGSDLAPCLFDHNYLSKKGQLTTTITRSSPCYTHTG
jgi:hypothetical protein